MAPIQLPLSLAQRHNNQQLFAAITSNVTLPGRPEWKLLVHNAAQVLPQVAPIVRAYVPSDNKIQTEEDLIRSIIRTLSHTFMLCQAQKNSGHHRRGW